jgi:hypothetical protein
MNAERRFSADGEGHPAPSTVARLALPLLVGRILAADDPDDATPLDNLARIAALFD